MYKTLPVNIVGQTYQSRSLPLSAQSTINLYPEFNPTGKVEEALQNWYGTKRFCTGTAALDRGSHVFKDVLYKVSGSSLYSVSSVGLETSIGTIIGSNRCIIDDDDTNMVITTGGTTYKYDGTTLSTISDVDLETPNSCAVLNDQFIFDGDNDRFVVAVAEDPTDIPSNNYAKAGDNLVRVYVFDQTLYLMCSESIRSWWNSGTGNPPVARIEGGIIDDVGLGALHSVAKTKKYFYFVGHDRNVYRGAGGQVENITPPAIAHQLFKLTTSDAIGTTLNIDSQDLYSVSFPSSGKTYIFSEQLGTWHQLSFGASGARHLMNAYHFVYGKRLVTDYRNGNVLELDPDIFTDDSEVQLRQRDTAPIDGIMLGAPGKRLQMSRFEIIMETGVGIDSGQGSDPDIKIGTSIDGGRVFNYEGASSISPGEGGQYIIKVELHKIISFYSVVIRIRVTDPIFISIHSAAIDLKLAGY